MSDIPEPSAEVEKVFSNLPVTMHLGDPKLNTIIGWANAWRNEDGTTTIVMSLSEEDSEKLGDLAEAFRLWAIGFAGVARREQPSDGKSGNRSGENVGPDAGSDQRPD